MPLRWGLLVVVLPAFARAELTGWHSFDDLAVKKSRAELVLHHRTRARHQWSYLDQSRVGAIFRWSLTPRLIPYAGYYFQPSQPRPHTWFRGHRAFFGVEAPFHLPGSSVLTTRLAMERHIGTGRPDYNRYRSYAKIVLGRGRVQPYLQDEWLFVHQGFQGLRNSGGLRVRVSPRAWFEAGYQYEVRRAVWGGDRHGIVTAVRFQPAPK